MSDDESMIQYLFYCKGATLRDATNREEWTREWRGKVPFEVVFRRPRPVFGGRWESPRVSKMSKKCAKCEKTVYPTEELKCLEKVGYTLACETREKSMKCVNTHALTSFSKLILLSLYLTNSHKPRYWDQNVGYRIGERLSKGFLGIVAMLISESQFDDHMFVGGDTLKYGKILCNQWI